MKISWNAVLRNNGSLLREESYPTVQKHKTLYGETEKFVNVKLAGTYFNHCTLRVNRLINS
jgi:hypothetical protein